MKVAVVGSGIVGLSAAKFLATRGHDTFLHERFPLFHSRGSSHGRSRIVRRAYTDAFYTACMAEAYPLWGALERESGARLVHECGLLYFGPENAPGVVSMIAGLESLNVPHAVLRKAETRKHIQGIRMESDEVAVYTPEAGWVDAATALQVTYSLAMAAGTQLVHREVKEIELFERDFDSVVLAPGPWISEFVSLDVRVSLQTFAYVEAAIEGPVWIDDQSLTYGFPSDELGQKIGVHPPGATFDPNSEERTPNDEHLRAIREIAEHRFGIANPTLNSVTTCLYTNTPDEDFRLGRIGKRTVFASACSGHGFKMGPWVGRILADIVEGKDAPENHPRFLMRP